MTERMPRREIREHYEQLSEFERGLIIELKQAGWVNRRIARHMCQMFSKEFRFQLCSANLRRRVWRRPGLHADPAFTIARHRSPQLGVVVWGSISFDSRNP
ncbi:hypothetical protein TNCV_2663081 [Trichonephila clavipes]|nr:hypothetical protein TNCV_2663081 [Trichonephila clavipes]